MNSSKPVPNECWKFFNCDHGNCTVQCCGSDEQFNKHSLTCISWNECHNKQTNCCCEFNSPCDSSCDSRSISPTTPTTQETPTTSTATTTSTSLTPTTTNNETTHSKISAFAVASIALNAVSFISILSLAFLISRKFSNQLVTMENNFKNLQYRISPVSNDNG